MVQLVQCIGSFASKVNICTAINRNMEQVPPCAWCVWFHTSGCIHLNGNPSSVTINVLIHGCSSQPQQCRAGAREVDIIDTETQARPRPLVWGCHWRPASASQWQQTADNTPSVTKCHGGTIICHGNNEQETIDCIEAVTEDDGRWLCGEAAPLPPGPAQHPCDQRGQGPREEEEDRRQVSWAWRNAWETRVSVMISFHIEYVPLLHGKYDDWGSKSRRAEQ